MSPRIAFLLLVSVIVSANEPLYDELKRGSSPEVQQSAALGSNPFLLGDPFNEKVRRLNGDEQKDYLPQTINVNAMLPLHYRKVIEDTLYLQLLLLSSVSFLTFLPQSVTSWNMEELQKKSLSERWFEHISTPPVWDHDHWSINFIGHPISGSWYYMMARNDGLSMSESATFSVLMSTFFWEYGYEAVAETPSIQDLIFTPLIGSILGEGMFILEGKLDQNGGLLFGSKIIGNISYFFLDPMGNIAYGMKNILNTFHINTNVTMTIQTYSQGQFQAIATQRDYIGYGEREYGFMITFQ